MTVKIFIGIAIILVSFVYIMKNHDKSLMDSLMGKRKDAMEEMQKLAEQESSDTSKTDNPNQD